MTCGVMNPSPMKPMIILTLILTLLINHSTSNIHLSFTISHTQMIPLEMELLLNWQTALFTLTVMIITSMIMLYSKSYMEKKAMKTFSLIMILFVSSMITLIISNNTAFVILGWDGLGLTSYLLVMHYQNNQSSAAASITILTNRLGDIMIISSLALSFTSGLWTLSSNEMFNNSTMLLLLVASMTKSAQFPFTAWLPAAMAAPTPVSALVHSSTLVTAGVVLMIRLTNHPHELTTKLLLVLATLTALTSSVSAIWESDLKKIIALSTLSQVSFMMMAISMNMQTLATFHLITHALFKATMFMSIGFFISNSKYQDTRSISTPTNTSPMINSTLGITSLALSGLPFISGFYSKDAILETNLNNSTKTLMNTILTMSILLTSYYNLRITHNAVSNLPTKSPDLPIPHTNSMTLSTFIMTPLVITAGTILTWTFPPLTSPALKTSSKMLPLMTIMLAMIFNTLSNKLTELNLKISHTATSMWMMNDSSSTPFMNSLAMGSKTMKIDNSWKESLHISTPLTLKMNINWHTTMTLTLLTLIITMM